MLYSNVSMTASSIIYVSGNKKLSGEVTLSGAKNSGFKLLIAALLSDEESTISNLSDITDLHSTIEIIQALGGKIEFVDKHTVRLSGAGLKTWAIPEKFEGLSRAAIYFVGPLLAKFGRAAIPMLGGCNIGKRPVDRHLEGFQTLGTKVTHKGNEILFSGKIKGGTFCFPKPTHGGTDTLLIASALSQGETILENVGLEPEIDDLINLLNLMGAKITRTLNRMIVIQGVKELHGTKFCCMSDRNEAVTFAVAALATKGDIFIKDANEQVLKAFLKKVEEAGGGIAKVDGGIRFFYKGPLRATRVVTKPHPGFMTDWQALWATLMTQAEGKSVIHETVFENRFKYAFTLKDLGADITFFNPKVSKKEKVYSFNIEDDIPGNNHAIKIKGPTPLQGIHAKVPDLRSGATFLLASLAARGESVIENAVIIERGYENLVEKFQKLGASIKTR